jgi:DNA-binding transcriptional LysR family regulator
MDKFQEMRAFVAVVEAGSFVRAADALQASKTAISRLVGDLELRLGTRLLHRTTRRLSLTEEGERFNERCRELLAGVAEAEAELTERAGRAVGPLRLNVPVSFGQQHLAPLWPRFMERHPQVLLEVTLSDRLVDLVDEGFDLAVRIARLPSSSLVSRKLATTRMVLCASPEYLRKHGTPKHPSELANHAVMTYTLLSIGEQWAFSGPQGEVSVRVAPRMRSNSGDTCCEAAPSIRVGSS